MPSASPTIRLRTDLGGTGQNMSALAALEGLAITKPFVFLTGSNGSGKSTGLDMIRRGTGLIGEGIGFLPELESLSQRYPLSKEDPTRTLVQMIAYEHRWQYRPEGIIQTGSPGAFDPRALGWTGQRIYLHDARTADAMTIDTSMDTMLRSMHRNSFALSRSHGEHQLGRLRYAIAWALGAFDLPDLYDIPTPPLPENRNAYDKASAYRDVHGAFTALTGVSPGSKDRPAERWLLLDEPETAISAPTLLDLLSCLIDAAAFGSLRVFCATHSALVPAGLGQYPAVQTIDLDGATAKLAVALRDANDPLALTARGQTAGASILTDAEASTVNPKRTTAQRPTSIHELAALLPAHAPDPTPRRRTRPTRLA